MLVAGSVEYVRTTRGHFLSPEREREKVASPLARRQTTVPSELRESTAAVNNNKRLRLLHV